MKAAVCIVLLSAILAPGLLAWAQANSARTPPPHYVRISAGVAEKLLIHKVEVHYPHTISRVSGTVVVAIEIDKNGDVLHPTVISGPAALQQLVLDAVQKYKYKPYLQNSKAVEVRTTVSVFVGLGL